MNRSGYCVKHSRLCDGMCRCPSCDSTNELSAALDTQEGGDHYRKLKIQPVEYILANGLGFVEGCVVKYVSRWREKGGAEDLRKARHFLQLLIEHEESDAE